VGHPFDPVPAAFMQSSPEKSLGQVAQAGAIFFFFPVIFASFALNQHQRFACKGQIWKT
jgi:hypothetical protein